MPSESRKKPPRITASGRRFKVLLVAMPDTVSSLAAVMRIPNLGICSLAGNLDDCEVRALDLAFARGRLTPILQRSLRELAPDMVGISAMSFQYASARRVALVCKNLNPAILTVLGGYHATLLAEQIAQGPDAELFDFIVRGEGEATFASLVREIAAGGRGLDRIGGIRGLSFRRGGRFIHNPPADLRDLASVRLPDRGSRVLDRSRFMKLRFDCVETSRGCTMGCTFCSIRWMYGSSVRFFPLDRVIEDLHRLKASGIRGVFFVDDNITLDVPRLKELCRLIVQEGLDSLYYVIQASVPGIASDPELPALLARASFRWVFLGIESGIARNLAQMRKNGVLAHTRTAVERLRANGICAIGGFIAGNPDDTRADIRDTYRFARDLHLDHAIVQVLTPYPKTEAREKLLAEGLVTNPDDFSRYNGFISNVRTRHLSESELNRWVVLYGARLYFSPRFFLASRVWWYQPADAPAMFLNNFRFLFGGLRGKLFASTHRW
jgi:anaerobic magnesium-protoporphyrin IX monomethyl ester cyclase